MFFFLLLLFPLNGLDARNNKCALYVNFVDSFVTVAHHQSLCSQIVKCKSHTLLKPRSNSTPLWPNEIRIFRCSVRILTIPRDSSSTTTTHSSIASNLDDRNLSLFLVRWWRKIKYNVIKAYLLWFEKLFPLSIAHRNKRQTMICARARAHGQLLNGSRSMGCCGLDMVCQWDKIICRNIASLNSNEWLCL